MTRERGGMAPVMGSIMQLRHLGKPGGVKEYQAKTCSEQGWQELALQRLRARLRSNVSGHTLKLQHVISLPENAEYLWMLAEEGTGKMG